jgi:hypothetical protein
MVQNHANAKIAARLQFVRKMATVANQARQTVVKTVLKMALVVKKELMAKPVQNHMMVNVVRKMKHAVKPTVA